MSWLFEETPLEERCRFAVVIDNGFQVILISDLR